MPALPMKVLSEDEAYMAVTSVLFEPDPARGDARRRLMPGLRRELMDAHAKHLVARGDVALAGAVALSGINLPYPVSAALVRGKANRGIKIASLSRRAISSSSSRRARRWVG